MRGQCDNLAPIIRSEDRKVAVLRANEKALVIGSKKHRARFRAFGVEMFVNCVSLKRPYFDITVGQCERQPIFMVGYGCNGDWNWSEPLRQFFPRAGIPNDYLFIRLAMADCQSAIWAHQCPP